MRRIIIFLAALLLTFQLQGQNKITEFFKRPSRKVLQTENDQLRTSLDSLQALVDSLEERRYLEDDELRAVIEGNDVSEGEEELEYTAEVSDSLLHLWYKNSFIGEFNTVTEYDMDSVKFSSNVSDAEMIRRLTAMNSFITLPFNENVKNYIILYSERMPSRMGRVMGLSNYYFPMFEEVLNSYGLPLELKYMAVIESMLNPVATSRAGARGMWQFMYGTARNYGLEINSFVDERLDVEKAMDAAARYLRDAYKIFGDWALAISSYNCGAGNVSKAIRRAGGSRDFWSIYPYLPRETRGYVPAFVGAMYAMTYYREYGIVPQNVGMPAQTDTFEIHRNLHFAQINSVVGVPMEAIKNLNPQYIHEIIPGNTKAYVLKLPYTWTNAFLETDRDSLYSFKADSLMSQKVLKDVQNSTRKGQQRIAYRVKSGDYLGRIASRHGVTVAQLKKWNNLKSSNIREGQILYIYGSSYKGGGSSSTSQKSGSTSSPSSRVYVVKQGDSLYNIAKLYPGVSAENIKAANGLKSDNIRPGQKLKIPLP